MAGIRCTALYCTLLRCTALYCIILHSAAPMNSVDNIESYNTKQKEWPFLCMDSTLEPALLTVTNSGKREKKKAVDFPTQY